ncbi:MAG: DNA-binding protein, partial [Myxococcales bacterium]|nr:DNA-binding protein [Myxococcales bacterium]
DVVVFRGDQNHGYRNVGRVLAVAFSAVVLAPGPA